MIEEAAQGGLNFNPRTVNQLAWGVQRKNCAVPVRRAGYTGGRRCTIR